MPPPAEVTIDPRFKGPPDSANGGYVCGLLGRELEGPFEATLRAPPPLGRPLRLERDGAEVVLADGETQLATARSAEPLGLEPPLRPDVERAREASRRSVALFDHPYPGCFVCGPEHPDGLRVFPGPLGPDRHAAVLRPGGHLPREGAAVAPEIVCAALDCPSFPWADGSEMLLGRLTVELLAPVAPEEDHVVVGWGIESEGRKHTTASALLSADGDLLACSRALWIAPRGS